MGSIGLPWVVEQPIIRPGPWSGWRRFGGPIKISGFRVWGLGFRFGVWGLGFRVWGLGFRV